MDTSEGDAAETTSGMVPDDDVDAFLRSWSGVAATLIDRHLTVSGSTRLAEALFPNLRRGVNLAREMFLEVIPRRDLACGAEMSDQVVAALQSSLAWHEHDAEFQKIIGELAAMSHEFSIAWAAERQALRPHGILRSTHPVAGELLIRYQLLELAAGWNDVLIVWQGADPDSEAAFGDLIPAA
ncbi:MAG: hypothetical protein JWQ43_3667 [Glaciihabitans sp.]|nr:hypothetical protein [Glaciihabitans sp.]